MVFIMDPTLKPVQTLKLKSEVEKKTPCRRLEEGRNTNQPCVLVTDALIVKLLTAPRRYLEVSATASDRNMNPSRIR